MAHGIAMRLKARNKQATEDTSNVLFETMLELIQDISVIIHKASPVHNQYVGDCHQCSLFCQKCYNTFGIKGAIFQVLYEAPYAALYHHGLELPEIIPNDTFDTRFCASLPMHTMPDHLNEYWIEITKRQNLYPRCSCGNGDNLKTQQDIINNHLYLHNLSEAMRIDSFFSGDMDAWNYNTTAMLFSIFDVMFHR